MTIDNKRAEALKQYYKNTWNKKNTLADELNTTGKGLEAYQVASVTLMTLENVLNILGLQIEG